LIPSYSSTSFFSESIFSKIAGENAQPQPVHSISAILSSVKENEVTSSEGEANTKNGTEILFETSAKLLFLAVKWAKSVPSFNQLPVSDQKVLLEESWAELFVLTSAQWGLQIDGGEKWYSVRKTFQHDKWPRLFPDFIAKNPFAKQLQKAIYQFSLVRVDYREAACLKALILFKPDYQNVYSTHEILMLQDQTLNLLQEKCGGVRLGHLLLLLPAIKAAANAKALQEMLFKKTVGEVAIERILLDLMKT
jgi:hypothetical protein